MNSGWGRGPFLSESEPSRPREGDLGPLCRIGNLGAFFSAFDFYHINDRNPIKLHKKREGRCSPAILPPQHVKVAHRSLSFRLCPVALPWEGNLWLSWGQLRAINTRGSPLHQPRRGGVNISLPGVLLRHSPLREQISVFIWLKRHVLECFDPFLVIFGFHGRLTACRVYFLFTDPFGSVL